MKNLLTITLLILFINSNISVFCQDSNINIDKIIEKVHLTTDREVYFSNENIFFTADYFVNYGQEIELSKVLYIELIETTSLSSIVQQKYMINNFKVQGRIEIPSEIPSGNYILKAYTNFQRNFSESNFAYQFVSIYNPSNNNINKVGISSTDSISIVCESDVLLENLENKFVIKIPNEIEKDTNQYFLGDLNGNMLKKLSLKKHGLISDKFTFLKNESYFLNIIRQNGDTVRKSFPKVIEEGLQCNLNYTESQMYLRIQTNSKNFTGKDYSLQIFNNQFKNVLSKDLHLFENSLSIQIEKDQLKEGINYLLIYDQNKIVKSLTFYKSFEPANKVFVEMDTKNFQTRESVNVKLTSLKEEESLPNLSISVSQKGSKTFDMDFNPALYLSHPILFENALKKNTHIKRESINDLMILFDKNLDKDYLYREIDKASNNALSFYPEMRGLSLSGIVVKNDNNQPVVNKKVYLTVLRNFPQLHITKTNEKGEFVFSLNNIQGLNDIYICPELNPSEEQEYKLLVKNSFSSKTINFSNKANFANSSKNGLIQDLYINAQINYKFKKRSDLKDELVESPHNINGNKKTILLDEFVSFENMTEVLYELVTNLSIKKNKKQYYFRIKDENDFQLSKDPLILLDNIPIFDANKILRIDPKKVKSIEIIDQPYILGENDLDGIIMIKTNTDDFTGISINKSAIFIEYNSAENQVFEENNSSLDNRIPDFKTTLYWNPDLKMNTSVETLEFKTTDRKGTYIIHVNGYNQKGEYFHGKNTFSVD